MNDSSLPPSGNALSSRARKNGSFIAIKLLLGAAILSTLLDGKAVQREKEEPDFAKARAFIREEIREKAIPSISVAVARRGEILWEESFGLADRERQIPATPDTMYYLASVDKAFTATALMILQERKRLNLDRPANDYLSGAKLSSPAWNPAEATLRRVANHTAGLTTFNPKNQLSIEKTIKRYGILFWPPGEQFDYSNLGFIILDDVVGRTAGKAWPDFLHDDVFVPLGMAHASVGVSGELEKYAAQRYGLTLKPRVTGRAYCSAHDLVRFGMFCLKSHLAGQEPILSDAGIEAMFSAPVSTGGGKYSLGWSIDDDLDGYRGILAQGGTDSDQAWLRLIPSEGIAVVALANKGSMSSQVVQEILYALLPSYGEASGKAQQQTGNAGKSKGARPKLPPATWVGNWNGIVKTFRKEIPLSFAIASSGEVDAKLGSGASFRRVVAKFDKEKVSGRMAGDLGIEEETGGESYELEFYLYWRDGSLKGAVVTDPSPGLPFWAELKKQD